MQRTGQMLLLKKGSKEGIMIALTHPDEGVQLGNPLMTDRGQLLMNSDRQFMMAQLIPAIVVPVCVTMVGLYDPLLVPMHDRELSNVVQSSSNSVWICSQCNKS